MAGKIPPDAFEFYLGLGQEGVLEEFEKAFRSAVDSRRPTLIDARITRKALPHYSPALEGLPQFIGQRIWDRIREWFHFPSD